jgi:hypothetical protein
MSTSSVVGPSSPPRKYISPLLKQTLLNFFSESLAFTNWTIAERNEKFRQIIKEPRYVHLNRDQIKRVFDLYSSTINLKKLIAKFVLDKTDEMIKDNSKSMSVNSMIAILANLYYDYSANGKYIGLPDKLRELLFICYNANKFL